MQVTVYRSSKKEGMYVYLADEEGLKSLPEVVMRQLGEPEYALSFELTKSRSLSNADPEEVLQALQEQGFYIQMPKNIEDILAAVAQRSAKS